MKVAFSTGRPAHVALPANLLAHRGIDVTIYTAAYRGRFRNLDASVHLHWVPQMVPTVHFLTGFQLPRPFQRADTVAYDHLVALRMELSREQFDIFWGWASGALSAGRSAHRRGAKFILDRACPHVDAQQALVQTECDRLGVPYDAEPRWFRTRQIAEYEEADAILVPSQYSRRSFPPHLQSKIIVAPLYGRIGRMSADPSIPSAAGPGGEKHPDSLNHPFTFGTVGGQPLRKGFLYLLQAWDKLKLPHARLLIRTDAALDRSPALRDLLHRLPNVERVGHVDDMKTFYRRCDAFVLPTIDDGFGMALLEAIAHGLPAIATSHCGAAELFRTEEEVLVVPPQNADALATAMERIYTSAELRDRLRTHAALTLQQIEGHGSYERYATALDQVLILAKEPSKSIRSDSLKQT